MQEYRISIVVVDQREQEANGLEGGPSLINGTTRLVTGGQFSREGRVRDEHFNGAAFWCVPVLRVSRGGASLAGHPQSWDFLPPTFTPQKQGLSKTLATRELLGDM